MGIVRKLLIPTLLWFALLFFGMIAIIARDVSNSSLRQEEQNLGRLHQVFQSRLEEQGTFSLSLAASIAGDPEIAGALAARDRPKLLELAKPSYQALRSQNGHPQFQFAIPLATSFLRLEEQSRFGDDLSAYRGTVLSAILGNHPASGLEIDQSGLGVHGVVPVQYESTQVGVFEASYAVGERMLQDLKSEFGADWQIILKNDAPGMQTVQGGEKFGPSQDLILQATTLITPLYPPSETYQQVLSGTPVVWRVFSGNQGYVTLSSPLRDYSGNIIGLVDIIADRSPWSAALNSRISMGLIAAVAALVIGGAGLALITNRILKPVTVLTETATAIAAGDLRRKAPVESQDEVGHLAQAFNTMTRQLSSMIGVLESRVAERTRSLERRSQQLQAATWVAREISAIQELDALLSRAAQQILERFHFHYVGILISDELGGTIHLKAAAGQAAGEMLAANLELPVGEPGMIGMCAQQGQIFVNQAIHQDPNSLPGRFQPDTISAMVLPLKYTQRVIGVLDLQSSHPNAFEQEDRMALETVADQLAAAIENTRLVERLYSSLQESQAAFQSQARVAWSDIAASGGQTAYEYDRLQVKPVPKSLPQELVDQLQDGKPIVISSPASGRNRSLHSAQKPSILIPVVVRGQMIGVIGIEAGDDRHVWTDDEIAIAEATANQVALTLENARLLAESRRQAANQTLIAEISARVRETLDVNSVLKIALREIGSRMAIDEVEVRMVPEVSGRKNGHSDEQ